MEKTRGNSEMEFFNSLTLGAVMTFSFFLTGILVTCGGITINEIITGGCHISGNS